MIPKAVRERLNLEPGSAVDLVERDGWLEVTPVRTEMGLRREGGAVVAATAAVLPVLTQDVVRDTVERGRR